MTNPRPTASLKLSKRLLFAFITTLVFLVGVEGLARVGSYVAYGFNPYYLVYGFKAWKTDDGHSEKFEGYFKFPPNKAILFNTPEPCQINNLGFRGKDFDPVKPAGTFRILCLGESSTFGYKDRDAYTYPAILQRLLDERDPDMKIEVINCGIPHANSDNILAMFRHELVSYDPDLVTYYAGYNDASFLRDENLLQMVQRKLDEYSAAYAGMRQLISKLGGHMHHRWMRYLPQTARETIDRQLKLHLRRTGSNLRSLIAAVQDRGIPIVLIKQPMTVIGDPRKEAIAAGQAFTYDHEYQLIASDLEENGAIPGRHVPLYIHHRLMGLVVELAKEHRLPLVDNVALIDARPEGLVTQVHLSEEANGHLAEAIYSTVSPLIIRRTAHTP